MHDLYLTVTYVYILIINNTLGSSRLDMSVTYVYIDVE